MQHNDRHPLTAAVAYRLLPPESSVSFFSASASPDASRRRLLLAGSAAATVATLSAWADLARAASPAPAAPMPVIFIGHGSPMNALRDTPFTQTLRRWGTELPRPTAILSVSAHWLTPGSTLVGVQERPRTIHDFGGFPAELHAMQYPAPGAPALAREAAAAVRGVSVRPTTEWGLDHGTWTMLHHLFPLADVPVFQLSIDYDKPGPYHLALGRELATLRERGVLILGSGNIVHNLRATDRGTPDGLIATRPWAAAFDEDVKKALEQRDDDRLARYTTLSMSAAMAVPTPDHYYPLLYTVGAAHPDEIPRTMHAGFQSGTLSMRCLQFGA